MADVSPHLRTLFTAALERPPGPDRAAYLDGACGGDAALRAEVEALLAVSARAGGFLEGAAKEAERTIDLPAVTEAPGTVIGAYKLLEQIGEGGFGVVYLAEQQEPVRRKVALKVLKPGMDTRSVVARFEAERQALALMDHPNIARVFDGGTTPAGRPYFVMELVRGVPITQFCDDHKLESRQRLELFATVCRAVQHAHQKGVIHRDLKPSNVLVSRHDTTPVVKVIDFGVAKALGHSLTDKTLFTGVAQMVGTPLYMSPEQAGMSDLDVDTRSDIYSLGVLLYELLTGTTPFTAERFKKAAYDEIRRIIREEEPPKPSTRLSESNDSLPSVAAQRHTEPAKLTKLVKGELDWMVMKALEKDRTRRYETANGFAADVQRYLAGEAVLAVPPSAGYRLRKFARRNKVALAVAAVVGGALLLAVGSLGWAVRDREAGRVRTAIEVNLFLERAEVLYAENKLPEALAEVEKARGVLDAGRGDEGLERRVRQWLTDLDVVGKFEEMRQQSYDVADPAQESANYARVFREYGIDVEALSVEEATARIAGSRIKGRLAGTLDTWAWRLRLDPRSPDPGRAERLVAIARAAHPYPGRLRLDRAAEAKDLKTLRELAAEADIGRAHPRGLEWLGTALTWAGDPEAGVALLRKAQRHHPGDFLLNESLARNLSELKSPPWDEVVAFRRVALALRPKSAAARAALVYALEQKGRFAEVEDAHREAVRLAPDDPEPHERLGWALQSQKKFPEMEAAFREVIRLKADHAGGHHGLGRALLGQSKSGEGIASLREAVRLGSTDHWAYDALGWALVEQGKHAEAEAAFREVVRLKPEMAHGHFGLGRALVEQEKFAETEAPLRDALRIEPTHPWVPVLLRSALAGQGKPAVVVPKDKPDKKPE